MALGCSLWCRQTIFCSWSSSGSKAPGFLTRFQTSNSAFLGSWICGNLLLACSRYAPYSCSRPAREGSSGSSWAEDTSALSQGYQLLPFGDRTFWTHAVGQNIGRSAGQAWRWGLWSRTANPGSKVGRRMSEDCKIDFFVWTEGSISRWTWKWRFWDRFRLRAFPV